MAIIIEGSQESLQGSNSTTFTMNMPATRPAGDLYVAIIGKDDGRTVNKPVDGNWIQAVHQTDSGDTINLSIWWKIGEEVIGSDESTSYDWTDYFKTLNRY